MTEPLQKHFTIDVHQKLYEKDTPHGNLEVYQTSPYGVMLTLNGHILMSEFDGFFYHEMMAHPALFTHPHPQSIAIIGNCHGILLEVLKHSCVTQVHCINDNTQLEEAVSQYFPSLVQAKSDPRVQYHFIDPQTWAKACIAETIDIVILGQHSDTCLREHYQYFYSALREDGILVQPCQSSFLHLHTLKPLFQNIQLAGFHDWQTLNFPQPSYPTGWRTTMMAMKRPTINRIREKDVFNRNFSTRYYNFDTHKAALALPEFMREEFDKVC